MTYKLNDPTLTATPIEDVVTRQLESATPADIAVFLQGAFETGDTKQFARCVGIAAKAVGMTDCAAHGHEASCTLPPDRRIQ